MSWILTIRPFIIPTEARDKLAILRHNRSMADAIEDTWVARAEISGPIRKSHKGWPYKSSQSNVVPIKRGKRNAGQDRS